MRLNRVRALTESGYSVISACEALSCQLEFILLHGTPALCSTSVKTNRGRELLERIKQIRCGHPFWSYRRVTPWLRRRCDINVNRKRGCRIMRKHNLTVKQKLYKAKRTPQQSKPKPIRMNQLWSIDMAKFLVDKLGWIYMVVVLEWYTRKIVSYHIRPA